MVLREYATRLCSLNYVSGCFCRSFSRELALSQSGRGNPSSDIRPQLLPSGKDFPQLEHVGTPGRILVAPGLGCYHLWGGALPLGVEFAPEFEAVALRSPLPHAVGDPVEFIPRQAPELSPELVLLRGKLIDVDGCAAGALELELADAPRLRPEVPKSTLD